MSRILNEKPENQSNAVLGQSESITQSQTVGEREPTSSKLCLMSVGDIAEWPVVWKNKKDQLRKPQDTLSGCQSLVLPRRKDDSRKGKKDFFSKKLRGGIDYNDKTHTTLVFTGNIKPYHSIEDNMGWRAGLSISLLDGVLNSRVVRVHKEFGIKDVDKMYNWCPFVIVIPSSYIYRGKNSKVDVRNERYIKVTLLIKKKALCIYTTVYILRF